MNWTAFMIFVAFMSVLACYIDFITDPEKYGDIMRRFDNVRYYQLDCDCTVDPE